MENYVKAHDTAIYDIHGERVAFIQWIRLTADVVYPFWKVEYAQRKTGDQGGACYGVVDYLFEAHLRSIGFEGSEVVIHLGIAVQVGSSPVASTKIKFADVTLEEPSLPTLRWG